MLGGLACQPMADHFIEEADHEPDVTKRAHSVGRNDPLHPSACCVCGELFGWGSRGPLWRCALGCTSFACLPLLVFTTGTSVTRHSAFLSRPVQFLMGLLGTSAVQRGPIWWAAHHRDHHSHSDTHLDLTPPSNTDSGNPTAAGFSARKLHPFAFAW